jgi:hypothetical protein
VSNQVFSVVPSEMPGFKGGLVNREIPWPGEIPGGLAQERAGLSVNENGFRLLW